MSVRSPAPSLVQPEGRGDESSAAGRRLGESGVVWTLWFTYGAFYFCRNNLAAAVPGMEAPIAEGGLGFDSTQTGWILASLKMAYGVGQLVNGQLAERFSPRLMLALGMFASASLSVLFGLTTGLYFLLFVWATNGYFQSLGWPPTVRVVGNWVPVLRRGKAIGIIGTGYQVTLGLTILVSTQAAGRLGWRGALYVPAALLFMAGLFMLVCLRDAPDDAERSAAAGGARDGSRGSWVENVLLTMSNPALWLLGLALGLLNACRYGFLDWGISHLMKVQNVGVMNAGQKYVVLAVGAVAGSYLAGWATDRFLGGRRAPMICVLLITLAGLTLTYESVAQHNDWRTSALLMVIGFCIFGPQVLLVGTAPADLARRGTAAAAAGFVNFVGYMGASAGDIVTGHFKQPENGGWQVAIYIWAGWAIAAAVFAGLLWNHTAHREEKS